MEMRSRNTASDFKITGNWKATSDKLKLNFSQLTSEDLHFEKGKENELLDRIGTRLNKKHDEVVHIIKRAEKSTNL